MSFYCLISLLLAAFAVPVELQSTLDIFDTGGVANQSTTIRSQGPSLSLAQKYVYLTGATYCFNLENWNCPWCLKAKANGQAFSSQVNNTVTNTLALITINTAAKEIVVTFRGSYNVANAAADASGLLVNPPSKCCSGSKTRGKRGLKDTIKKVGKKIKDSLTKNKPSKSGSCCDIKVHSGFLKATQSLYPKVVRNLAKLLKANPTYSVVIAGHSLGAALASVCLFMLQQRVNFPPDFKTPSSYSYFGYGEPRVGNQAYADYWNKQSIQITRITNQKDPVPHVATPSMGYVHHGTELWIQASGKTKSASKNIYEDPTCSNSQGPTYNPADHLKYFDVAYVECAVINPVAFVTQLAV